MPSVEMAIRDAVAAWLGTLRFGASSFALSVVRGRHPAPDDTVTLPAAALIFSGRYDNRPPEEVPGSRGPEEGDGTYLEQTGELVGQVSIVLFAAGDQQADEVVEGIEQALCDPAEKVPRLVLRATTYHNQTVTLRRSEVQTALWRDTAGTGVWRPIFVCDASCPVVRQRGAADLLPRIDLMSAPPATLTFQIDPVEGTTTETEE